MKLEKWALIAEIISGIAIVATLMLLIVQVRSNTDAIRVSNRQSIATRSQELGLFLAEHPEVSATIRKLGAGEETTPLEIFSAQTFSNAQLRLAEESYLLFNDGQLEEEYWLTRASLALGMLGSPELRRNYEQVKDAGWFTSEFIDWVDARLAVQSNE